MRRHRAARCRRARRLQHSEAHELAVLTSSDHPDQQRWTGSQPTPRTHQIIPRRFGARHSCCGRGLAPVAGKHKGMCTDWIGVCCTGGRVTLARWGAGMLWAASSTKKAGVGFLTHHRVGVPVGGSGGSRRRQSPNTDRAHLRSQFALLLQRVSQLPGPEPASRRAGGVLPTPALGKAAAGSPGLASWCWIA